MADDVDILFPDQTVKLSTGEKVTVRQFTIEDGMRADTFAYPLIADIHRLYDGAEVDMVPVTGVMGVLGKHVDITLELLSIAISHPVEWIKALGDADGQLLLQKLWAVNTGFFMHRLVMIHQAKKFQSVKSSPA